MKGYGPLIEQARLAIGLSPVDLGRKIRRSKGIVYRLEQEVQEPDVEQVNALVAALPLSAEQLLTAMGVRMVPPEAAKLPLRLVEALVQLPPQELEALTLLAVRAAASVRQSEERAG